MLRSLNEVLAHRFSLKTGLAKDHEGKLSLHIHSSLGSVTVCAEEIQNALSSSLEKDMVDAIGLVADRGMFELAVMFAKTLSSKAR